MEYLESVREKGQEVLVEGLLGQAMSLPIGGLPTQIGTVKGLADLGNPTVRGEDTPATDGAGLSFGASQGGDMECCLPEEILSMRGDDLVHTQLSQQGAATRAMQLSDNKDQAIVALAREGKSLVEEDPGGYGWYCDKLEALVEGTREWMASKHEEGRETVTPEGLPTIHPPYTGVTKRRRIKRAKTCNYL